MRDPGLAELELALTWRCDTLRDSAVTLEGGEVLVVVHWRYRGREFRARLVVPPGRRIAPHRWLLWRLCGRSFGLLPSRPCFECHGPRGWQRADTVARWRGMFGMPGVDAPGDVPGELSGRPVRPRPGLPALGAGAAATPALAEYEVRYYPMLALRRRSVEE